MIESQLAKALISIQALAEALESKPQDILNLLIGVEISEEDASEISMRLP